MNCAYMCKNCNSNDTAHVVPTQNIHIQSQYINMGLISRQTMVSYPNQLYKEVRGACSCMNSKCTTSHSVLPLHTYQCSNCCIECIKSGGVDRKQQKQSKSSKNQKQLAAALKQSLEQQKILSQKLLTFGIPNEQKKAQIKLLKKPYSSNVKVIKRQLQLVRSCQKSDGRIWRKINHMGNKTLRKRKGSSKEFNQYGLFVIENRSKALIVPKYQSLVCKSLEKESLKIRYPILGNQVYRDSTHRNKKHEKQHLHETFNLQDKIRKKLIERIWNNSKSKGKFQSKSVSKFIRKKSI